jgi:hypothetical protein
VVFELGCEPKAGVRYSPGDARAYTADNRIQKTENRRKKTENRRKKTDF